MRDGLRHLELDQVLRRIASLPTWLRWNWRNTSDPGLVTLELIGDLRTAVRAAD